MAAPMNGAVQGVAATTASTPVKNEPARAAAGRQAGAHALGQRRPDLEQAGQVQRRASSIRAARAATTGGSCSWKPQPSGLSGGPERDQHARDRRKVTSTPAPIGQALAPRARPPSPPWPASASAFMASTGKRTASGSGSARRVARTAKRLPSSANAAGEPPAREPQQCDRRQLMSMASRAIRSHGVRERRWPSSFSSMTNSPASLSTGRCFRSPRCNASVGVPPLQVTGCAAA